MYEVEIRIGANANKYWGKMQFEAKNQIHKKEIEGERSASKQSNTLEALIKPCMLSIYSTEDYIISAFQQGWLQNWQKNNWKNSQGNTIRNAEQWKELWELLKPHSRRVMKGD